MVCESIQKQRKYSGSKKVVSNFSGFDPPEVDFSNFDQNRFSKRLKRCLGTKNEVEEGNWLFSQFFNKIFKKGKKGTIYVDFSQNLKFRVFRRNFLFKRLQRLASAFSKLFSGNSKVLCLGSIAHKWFVNRYKSKENIEV